MRIYSKIILYLYLTNLSKFNHERVNLFQKMINT